MQKVITTQYELIHLLKNGETRRVYLKKNEIPELSFYITYIAERSQYVLFLCDRGEELALSRDILFTHLDLSIQQMITERRLIMDVEDDHI